MKVEDIRNVGIAGHGGSGKTTLAEAMLFNAGVINRSGRVEDGNTVSDFHKQEIERKISINTSMMHLPWMDHKVNLVDMPGYQDFIGEVYGGMHVVDIGVILLDAHAGIEVGTEIAWKYAKKHELSKFIVVNKLDREEISFDRLAEEIREKFGENAVVTQFPYKSGEHFNSVVDLIRGKLLVYPKDGGGAYEEQRIPRDIIDQYEEYRLAFMESVIEHDEALMNKYLDDEEVTEAELKKALSTAVKHNEIYPICCISAAKNVGVTRLLELFVKYGASASDLPDVHAKDPDGNMISLPCAKDRPLAAQIFKTISEPHVGELSFVKVYAGTLEVGQDVYNANEKTTERISTLYLLNGKERKDTRILECGDMGAIIKLKHSHTNETLCDPEHPVIIDQIRFPQPSIRAALVAPNKGEEDRISLGLYGLHQEDPTFQFNYDPELRETIVSGQGEMQLDYVIHRLMNRFHVEVDLAEPHIPYRETIRKTVSVRKRYKKQTGGHGQFGDVHIEVKPLPRGGGFNFINNIVGGVIPTKYIPAVEKGVKTAMEEGSLIGAPVVDVEVRLFDGSQHSVDSSDMSFQTAGAMAMREALEDAAPMILEPIYALEIRIPEDYLGSVMGDVSSRRGKVLGMEVDGRTQVIHAEVPLSELWKYSTDLRSMTQGRGAHSRAFSHYEPVSKEVQSKLIELWKKEHEAEH